jgi:hypothetical protein
MNSSPFGSLFKRRHTLFRPTAASPTTLVWCGSFEGGGGATIDDLHAVENLSLALPIATASWKLVMRVYDELDDDRHNYGVTG